MSEGDSKATPVQMPTGSGTRRAPEASIIKTDATDLLATPSTRHAASDAEATSSGPAVDDAAAATAADCSSGGGGASSGGGGDILRYEIVLTGVIWAVLMGSYQDHAPRITLIPLHLGALLLANFVLYKVREGLGVRAELCQQTVVAIDHRHHPHHTVFTPPCPLCILFC